MIIGIGVDITEVGRIKKNLENDRFVKKVYSRKEEEYLISRKFNAQTAAGLFASKEAVAKSLGTGFSNFGPRHVEILKNDDGKPYVNLTGNAFKRAKELGITNIHLSISHTEEYATAFCIVE